MEYYGSKTQVYNGNAKITKGGLTKKDILKVKDSSGNVRYKSKLQQKSGKKKNTFREKWAKAVKKARSQLIKEGVFTKKDFIPVGGKTKEGKALYSRVKSLI